MADGNGELKLPPGVKPTHVVDWHPPTGRIGGLLDPANSCHGGWHGYCGGCDGCLLLQARHAGWSVEPVTSEIGRVLLDALIAGRTNAKRDNSNG